MSKKSPEYLEQRRKEMSKRRYDKPLTPLEAAILRALPAEESKIGKYKHLAYPVKVIITALEDDTLTHDEVTACVRSMKHRELLIDVELIPANQGLGWQRTKRGDEFLRDYNKSEEKEDSDQE